MYLCSKRSVSCVSVAPAWPWEGGGRGVRVTKSLSSPQVAMFSRMRAKLGTHWICWVAFPALIASSPPPLQGLYQRCQPRPGVGSGEKRASH